jgi:hypothetical protein
VKLFFDALLLFERHAEHLRLGEVQSKDVIDDDDGAACQEQREGFIDIALPKAKHDPLVEGTAYRAPVHVIMIGGQSV